jgi:HTH-type transcriptional regulator / antitoxin HigA
MTSRRPAEAFPPGEFLKEELEERGWSQSDFAAITEKDVTLINGVIKGKRSITIETARAFADALGTSPEYWLNLESAYRLWEASADERSETGIRRRARLYEYPIRDMSRRGWVDNQAPVEILERQLTEFFGRQSLEDVPHMAHAAKKSGGVELTPGQLAWMFRVKNLAEAKMVPSYSAKNLRGAVESMRSLRKAPEDTKRVAQVLADAGVRYVIVEGLPGLKVDGVCFWLDDRSPVVGMSIRYDRIDNFWFVLRHELEHVLSEDAKGKCLEDVEPDSDVQEKSTSPSSDQETRANRAAEEFCVPREILDAFIEHVDPFYSSTSITAFAETIDVHPGIVVGQLHNRHKLPFTHHRKLLASVRSFVIEMAVTDGWGNTPQVN